MKFVFIAPRFHTNFYYPIKALIDHGHEVEFLALWQGKSEDHSLLRPIILGQSSCRLPPLRKFLSLIWRSQAQVLVVKDIVTPYSLLALFVGRLLGKKLVVMTQIPKYRAKPTSGAVLWLWRLFRAHALTPVLGDKRFANANHNLIYVPFVIPVNTDKRSYFQKDDQITILCVGKFQLRKNQLLLVRAVEQLKERYSVRLLLSGQEDEADYLAKLRLYIKDRRLEALVEILPHLSWGQMPDLYQQSDIFVLPSFAESAAYSILEAMSHGLPVVSSDDNGTKWYIKSGVNGYVFDHKSLEDLQQKLELILNDRSKLVAMGQESLVLTAAEHDPERFYQTLMEILS